PLETDNFLYLRLTPRENPVSHGTGSGLRGMDKGTHGTDKPDHPKGKRGLRVTCLVPFERPMLPPDREALRKAILNHLIWLMPFSDGHIDYLGDEVEDTEKSKYLVDFLGSSHKL